MKIFSGLAQTDYQDIFRAIGALVDQQRLRDVRVWEHADGIIVQGRRPEEENGRYQSILLSDDDLRALLEQAYRRRNAAASLGQTAD